MIILKYTHPAWRSKNMVKLYECICRKKGYKVAVDAEAHHLSEAAYGILRKNEVYREPKRVLVFQTE